jgi:hypothetical protein
MKNCWKSSVLVAVAIVVTTLGTASLAAQQENDRELLQVREAFGAHGLRETSSH